MAVTDAEWIELGSRFSTARLIEQAAASLEIARAYEAKLAKDFPKARMDEMQTLLDRIRVLYGEQADKKVESSTGNSRVQDTTQEAKDWMRDLLLAADNAFEEQPETHDEFRKLRAPGRSVAKQIAALNHLVALGARFAKELSEWGFEPSRLEEGRKLSEQLQSADSQQEKAVAEQPAKTKELNLAKGQEYLLLKKLSRVGRKWMKDDPISAAKLNLGILNRRGTRPAPAEPPATP